MCAQQLGHGITQGGDDAESKHEQDTKRGAVMCHAATLGAGAGGCKQGLRLGFGGTCVPYAPPERRAVCSAVRHVDCQTAERGFFVFVVHISTSLAHGFNAGIQWHEMLAIAAQGQ
ncbi:hypothetical protein PhaeoP97_02248 [Phaeobacter porticola]|uniref:Uncharacterized protein n=1 Tax=Phaeobacter porticola TaxID=1844006 RepID=A0A1L3I6J8_9RHOB|nr:hypothetical protein PhaeoP97_02248 [Phaeobacter porticola]